jgi:hypothetical protein
MEFKEYDFTRNPVAQNQAIFLESKCAPPTVCRPWCAQLESRSNTKQLHRMQYQDPLRITPPPLPKQCFEAHSDKPFLLRICFILPDDIAAS